MSRIRIVTGVSGKARMVRWLWFSQRARVRIPRHDKQAYRAGLPGEDLHEDGKYGPWRICATARLFAVRKWVVERGRTR